MKGEMRSDADLLNALCDEAPHVIDRLTGNVACVSKKVIATWTGLAVQTVSDYATGKYNIPIDFWARILNHYYDSRIARLLFHFRDDVEIMFQQGEIPTSRSFFSDAVTESGAHHKKQTYIATLLADGRIDELDASTIQAYDDAYYRHREIDCALHAAVMRTYRKSLAAKEASR